MAIWKGRDCVCSERFYLAAHGAAVAHPLPRRQHLLAERRVATRETQSKALLLFTVISGTLLTYTARVRAALQFHSQALPLIYREAPWICSPIHPLSQTPPRSQSSMTPSQLHGFRAPWDSNSRDKWKIHWCATHIPPPTQTPHLLK